MKNICALMVTIALTGAACTTTIIGGSNTGGAGATGSTGTMAQPCLSGEFPCPPGQACIDGACGPGAGASGGGGTGGGGGHCDGIAMITTQADVAAYADCVTLGSIYVHDSGDDLSVVLPMLTSVSGDVYFYHASKLGAVSLPALTSVGAYLYLDSNVALTSFEAPALTSVGQYVYVVGNPSLTSFNVSALASVGAASAGESNNYTNIVQNAALCVEPSVAAWQSFTVGAVTIADNKTICP
jgi:hypothetical protein